MDLERWDPTLVGQFDAVLCFGLLYHLAAPAEFLRACARLAPWLYLETVVSDSDEVICRTVPEHGPDQAWSSEGCRPSPAWLNRTLHDLGFDVRDISTSEANWGGPAPSVFDWAPIKDGEWERDGAMLRKMLICCCR